MSRSLLSQGSLPKIGLGLALALSRTFHVHVDLILSYPAESLYILAELKVARKPCFAHDIHLPQSVSTIIPKFCALELPFPILGYRLRMVFPHGTSLPRLFATMILSDQAAYMWIFA